MTRRLGVFLCVLVLGCGDESAPGTVVDGAGLAPETITPETSTDTVGENQAPVVSISSPDEGAVFAVGESVSFLGQVSDDRDAAESLSVRWSTNLSGLIGDESANAAGAVLLDSDDLVAGTHTVTLSATDSAGLEGSAEVVVVINAPPTAPEVTILPEEPTASDELVAEVTGESTDPNRASDQLNYSYQWVKDGVDAGILSEKVPASQTSKGQTWLVRVRANDGTVDGPEGTAQVVIANSPPVCPAAMILPSSGGTGTDFTCSCPELADADAGDEITSTCVFRTDGTETPSAACILSATETVKGMTLSCEWTPNDGELDGETVESEPVLVQNTPPTPLTDVYLNPTGATVETELACTFDESSTDLDGDTVNYKTTWVVNGYENAGSTTTTLLPIQLQSAVGVLTTKGDSVLCRVRASDGESDSSPVDSNAVMLDNSSPVGGAVLVKPVGAKEGDTLTCEAGDAVDPDGDGVSWLYAWTVNDEPVEGEEGPTLSSEHFDKGDVVTCTATPTDGESPGQPVASKIPVQIQNSLPIVLTAKVTPSQTNKLGALSCSYEGWSDADEADTEEVTYAWLQVGEGGDLTEVVGQSEASLLPTMLSPDTDVLCRVTPVNGNEAGEPVDSNFASIINNKPSLASVTLGPLEAYADSVLICTPEGFDDSDGDSPLFTYAWQSGNAPIVGADQPTLVGSFQKGDQVRCSVTPFDGYDEGTPVLSNPVVIGNKLPVISEVTLEPAFGAPCDTYTCVIEEISDPDIEDTVLVSYRWEWNGEPIAWEIATLSSWPLKVGDQLQCFVSATDGTLDDDLNPVVGPEAGSNLADTYNAKPSVDDVLLTPIAAPPGGMLTCTPSGFDDPDCGAVPSYVFKWYKGSQVLDGQSADTLDTTGLPIGVDIACQAVPYDGYEYGTPKLSNTVTLGNTPPKAPVVAVEAPQGADGDVQCVVVQAAEDDQPLSTTFAWSINGGEPFAGTDSLAAGAVAHCDFVTCQATASDGVLSTDSNVAEKLLPVGTDCDDAELCTTESCLPTGGCAHAANTLPCDDGNACTEGDVCGGKTCQSGDGLTCDDGLFCNGIETCDASGGCLPGGALELDDGVDCTVDACDEDADELTHITQDSACDDGQFCNGAEDCDATLGCQTGSAPDLDDDVVCTVDMCDESKSQVEHVPTDSLCDDTNPCTTNTCADTGCISQALANGTICASDGAMWCQNGVCVPNETCDSDLSCNDSDPCTCDRCVDSKCASAPVPDGGTCGSDTTAWCQNGECVSKPCVSDGMLVFTGGSQCMCCCCGSNSNNKYLLANVSPDLSNTPEATIEFWLRLDTYSQYGAMMLSDPGLGVALLGDCGYPGSKRFKASANWGSGSVTSLTKVPLGVWRHYALTFDNGTLRFFVDGTLQGSSTSSESLTPSISGNQLYFGGKQDGGNGNNMHQVNGAYRAIRVSKGVRYTSDFIPPETLGLDCDTMHLYGLNEMSGSTVYDSADSSFTGTLIKNPTWATYAGCP